MTARPQSQFLSGAIVLALLLWLAPAFAEATRPLKGVALVIGQSKYQHLPALANTGNDAREINQLLTRLGFETRSVADRDAAKLARDLERFAEDAEGADAAVLYYSGHGIEAGGENYLLPIDADLDSLADADERLVPIARTITRIKQSVPVTILFLDACRTNPFPPGTLLKSSGAAPGIAIGASGLGAPKGATPIESTPAAETLGLVIGYAAEPGHAALDGVGGSNSPYAAALIRHLSAMKGVEFGAVMRMVTEEVYLKTQGRQRPWVNESLRRLLYFGAEVPEPAGDDALITGERRQLLLTIAALPDAERRQVETIARDGGVPLDALYGVLRALGESQMPQDPGALEMLLRQQAEKLKIMMAERQALETDDPEIAHLAAAADRAVAEGAIATARQFLDRAVARVVATQDAVDRTEAKLKAKRLADAAVYEKRGFAAFMAFDYLAGARDYQTAFELAEKWDARRAWSNKVSVASLLQQHGFNRGDLPRLRQSIDIYREAVALTLRGTEIRDKWVYTQNELGNALRELALRENSMARFDEADVVYRALEEYPLNSRAIDPRAWAAIQNNLGILLQEQGLRGKGTAKLERSAAAFRSALAARPRESDPHAWARTMNNLGNTLQFIGKREKNVAILREALAALNAALEVRTREASPIDWAQTQHNVGLVQQALAEAIPDPSLHRAAADAFRLALEETPRARFPLNWNKIHGMLVGSLYRLKEEGREEAIIQYRQALAQTSRARDPEAWAAAQHNLGTVLSTLGGSDQTTARLEEAAAAFGAVLSALPRESDPLTWADSQYQLGSVLHKLGRREDGTDRLEEAVRALREATRAQSPDTMPFEWASTQAELGSTLSTLGQRRKSAADLVEAIARYQDAIRTFEGAGSTYESGLAERGLILARALLEVVRKP